MIDLNNTWCEATDENYDVIIKFYNIIYTCDIQDIKYYEFLRNDDGLLTPCAVSLYEEGSKQIHLVNGKFEYVKPKNNFKEYGFEADFDGEILAVKDDKYFGISKSNESEGWVANGWKKDGTCLYDDVSHLKPIKKEWYEVESNFEAYKGKLIINKYGNVRRIQSIDKSKVSTAEQNMYHDILKVDEWRPATKEEILTLLIKED